MKTTKKGEFFFEGDVKDRVYVRLSEKTTLCIHKADEGIVLDAWTEESKEAIWSTYHLDNTMTMNETPAKTVKFVIKQHIQENIAVELEPGQSPEQMLASLLTTGDYDPDTSENAGETECWIEDEDRNLIPVEPEWD